MAAFRSYSEKIILETLKETGIKYRINHQGTHAVLTACPVCSQKNKFFADLVSGRFICHNCVGDGKPIKGGLANFVSICRNESFEDARMRLRSNKKISALFNDTEGEEGSIVDKIKMMYGPSVVSENDQDCYDLPEIKLPPHAIKMVSGSPAYEYLRGRKMPETALLNMEAYEIPASSAEELHKLARGLSENDRVELYRHSGRVIFVQKVLGKVVGYISRDYTGKRDKKKKVLNSIGSWRQYCLYDWDFVKNQDRIIVTEGIVSSSFCGPEATATYGNSVSGQQVELLMSSKSKEIAIMVEVGAEKNAYKLAYALMAHKLVKLVFLPKEKHTDGQWKDCANYTLEENLELIEESPYVDEYEITKIIKEMESNDKKEKNSRGKKEWKNFRANKLARLTR